MVDSGSPSAADARGAMSGESLEDYHHRRFTEIFGVSEDDLNAQGIDTAQYARDHIREVVKDRHRWNRAGIPKSSQLSMLWTQWGYRAFIAMFVGYGFLAISITPALHWLGLAGAFVMLAVAFACVFASLRYRHHYVLACKRENIEPEWRARRRAMFKR